MGRTEAPHCDKLDECPSPGIWTRFGRVPDAAPRQSALGKSSGTTCRSMVTALSNRVHQGTHASAGNTPSASQKMGLLHREIFFWTGYAFSVGILTGAKSFNADSLCFILRTGFA